MLRWKLGCYHRARFNKCTSDQESPVYTSDCLSVLNYTDGVSGVNHSLAGCELSLPICFAVSSALYVLPSA